MHMMAECPAREGPEWEAVKSRASDIHNGVFRAKRFKEFSGYFDYGIPQAICDRWEADPNDSGQFRQGRHGRCQYIGIMLRVIGAVF